MPDNDDQERAERPRKRAVTDAPTATPEQHRAATGTRADTHAAAEALHGWALHAHHAAVPILLNETDYRAAIEAVTSYPVAPHPGALSPHAGRRL